MNNILLKKNYLKSVSQHGYEIIKNAKPVEKIKQELNLLEKDTNCQDEDFLNTRIYEMNKYKLMLFLNNQLQQEIENSENLINNKITNKILSSHYEYKEEKENLFLHKKVNSYYLIVHFRKLKPSFDKRKYFNDKNEYLDMMSKNFNMNHGVFHTLAGIEYNPEAQEGVKEDLMRIGKKLVDSEEPYYDDKKPFYFNINIINSKANVAQFICYMQSEEIFIDHIKFYENTQQFLEKENLNLSDLFLDYVDNENYLDNRFGLNSRTYINKMYKDNLEKHKREYDGPSFYTLNKKLQEQFIQTLHDFGVTPEIGNYMRYLGLNKEKREYIGWLFKTLNFISN